RAGDAFQEIFMEQRIPIARKIEADIGYEFSHHALGIDAGDGRGCAEYGKSQKNRTAHTAHFTLPEGKDTSRDQASLAACNRFGVRHKNQVTHAGLNLSHNV